MAIQWYPGHMAKANREIKERLKQVDLLIDVRDARIPESSVNPQLASLAPDMPRMILLNKADKADPQITKLWIEALTSETVKPIAVSALKSSMKNVVIQEARRLTEAKRQRQIRKGIKPTPMKAMVVGIPNVGKSTVINCLTGKKIAISADHPGVTKKLTWIKASDDLFLVDTPGVLWPKIDDEQSGLRLAVTGAIRDEILPLEDVVAFALKYLAEEYPEALKNRYKIEISEDPEELFNAIAVKRGLLVKGGEIDRQRVVTTILKEIRTDALGPISWEKPQ